MAREPIPPRRHVAIRPEGTIKKPDDGPWRERREEWDITDAEQRRRDSVLWQEREDRENRREERKSAKKWLVGVTCAALLTAQGPPFLLMGLWHAIRRLWIFLIYGTAQ